LPQIAILGVWHPDPRKAILQHQLQYELRILPIRLLLPYSLAPNLGRISDPQLKPQFVEQTLEPARVSAGLHAHAHDYAALLQFSVKLFRFLAMTEPSFTQSPGVCV
jgi:hypothetical protein